LESSARSDQTREPAALSESLRWRLEDRRGNEEIKDENDKEKQKVLTILDPSRTLSLFILNKALGSSEREARRSRGYEKDELREDEEREREASLLENFSPLCSSSRVDFKEKKRKKKKRSKNKRQVRQVGKQWWKSKISLGEGFSAQRKEQTAPKEIV
jgi:hypothetical protein